VEKEVEEMIRFVTQKVSTENVSFAYSKTLIAELQEMLVDLFGGSVQTPPKYGSPLPNIPSIHASYRLALCGIVVSWLVCIFEPAYLLIPIIAFFAPIIAATCFVFYWSSRYYQSITFRLTGDEVVVERGVWWRIKSTVPYARVMLVGVVQGSL